MLKLRPSQRDRKALLHQSQQIIAIGGGAVKPHAHHSRQVLENAYTASSPVSGGLNSPSQRANSHRKLLQEMKQSAAAGASPSQNLPLNKFVSRRVANQHAGRRNKALHVEDQNCDLIGQYPV